MIALHPDCLIIQNESGVGVPQTVESFTLEVVGEIDMEVVKEASAAVVHYFRHELRQEMVTVEEFTFALELALDRMGYDISQLSFRNPQADCTPFIEDLAVDPEKN